MNRSKDAVGRITISLNNNACSSADSALDDFLDETPIEFLEYSTDQQEILRGGLWYLYQFVKQDLVRETQKFFGGIDIAAKVGSKKPQRLIALLSQNKFDILLLLNSIGTNIGLEQAIEAFARSNLDNGCSVVTVATTRAESGASFLFNLGTQRIARKGTTFMLHYPTFSNNKPVSIEHYREQCPLFSAVIERHYQIVLDRTTDNHQKIRKLFISACSASSSLSNEVRWKGRDSPGHITHYFRSDTSLITQISQIAGRAVRVQGILNDPLARFSTESEMERLLQLEGFVEMYITIGSKGLVVDFDAKKQPGDLQSAVQQIFNELASPK